MFFKFFRLYIFEKLFYVLKKKLKQIFKVTNNKLGVTLIKKTHFFCVYQSILS